MHYVLKLLKVVRTIKASICMHFIFLFSWELKNSSYIMLTVVLQDTTTSLVLQWNIGYRSVMQFSYFYHTLQ